jgi:phenylacetate-CoA ligase
VIEATVGGALRQRYGSSEVGLAAHECPEGRLHVAAEGVIVEVVRDDGSPAAPGELGQVLVTVLRNRATPILRYRIGDLAEMSTGEPCRCGRGLPTLGRLVGRANELLLDAGGRFVVPAVVGWAIETASESVLEFQVVQAEDLSVQVLVVQRDDPPPGPYRDRIAEALDELLGLPGATTVERIDEIPLSGAGKLRHIVSHASSVAAPEPAGAGNPPGARG